MSFTMEFWARFWEKNSPSREPNPYILGVTVMEKIIEQLKASPIGTIVRFIKKLLRWPSTQRIPYQIHRVFGGRNPVSAAFRVVINNVRSKRTVLFYPKMPSQYQVSYKLCTLMGYDMHSSPDQPFDLAIAHIGTTIFPENLFEPLGDLPLINRNATDISKKRVEQEFENIFGYAIGIDPETFDGLALRKSNDNYTHDGEIIQCPTTITPDQKMTYQRYIDSRTEDDFFWEMRVPVYRSEIPLIYLKYRPDTLDRFNETSHTTITEPGNILSLDEQKNLVRLAGKMGVDYGEMDVLRDNTDGRIYVVDVNRAPAGPRKGMTDKQCQAAVKILMPAFKRLIEKKG